MSIQCPSCGTRNIEGADECCNCGADLTSVNRPAPTSSTQAMIMNRPVGSMNLGAPRTLSPDAPLEDAVHLFASEDRGFVSIVDPSSGKLLGVLSVRDVMRRCGANYPPFLRRPVSDFMTANPVTLPPDAPVAFALNKMDVGGHRHVPVVEQGELRGVVGVRDVLRLLVKA